MATVAQMTLEELKHLIETEVDRRLKVLLGEFEIDESAFFADEPEDNRSREEVFASIDANMWTPPPGAPTPLEYLREDRDR